MSSGIVGVLHFAIDSITDQQDAVANNIANQATPGFTDSEVSFEQSLQHALAAGGPMVAQESVYASGNPAATNGNNVDLGQEMVEAEQATLHYQQVSDSLNAQFRLVSGASGGTFT